MPDMQRRRMLLALIIIGVVLSCAGTLLYITAPTMRELEPRIGWVRLLLCGAWLILVPIFIYMIRLRSGARRVQRRRLQERQAELERQLGQMVTPEGIREIGGGAPAGSPDGVEPGGDAQAVSPEKGDS